MSQVQDSSDCCINSKFSCAQKGYFEDEYLSLFIKKLHPRSPIINRGYYIRFKAIEEILQTWWSSMNSSIYKKFQIISLGAGYDSAYLRLKRNNKLPPGCHYVEIDFPEVLKKKLLCIEKLLHVVTSSENQPVSDSAIVYHSSEYSLLGLDLRESQSLSRHLDSIDVEPSAPTLFLSECSITYMEPEDSKELIIWAQRNFPNSTFVTYEQVYPDDAFGLIMRGHFTRVGCSLKSITQYPDEDSQIKRFTEMGWSECSCITMYDLYCSLSEEEKERIRHLELFDEFEMWHEKCHHYVLVQACQGLLLAHPLQSHLPKKVTAQLYNLGVQASFNWKLLEASGVIQRFGHQAVPLSSSVIMVSGGFGISDKKHQKLGDMVLYDVKSAKHQNVPVKVFPRMFHTAVKLLSDSIVLLGGRASPKKAYGDILVISYPNSIHQVLNNDPTCMKDQNLSISFTTRQYLLPMPVWRNSSSLVTVEGIECIFIFGGCSVEDGVTNKSFLLNTETWQVSEIIAGELTPSARHSHSCATYKNSMVIVSGGLSPNECILQSVHAFHCNLSTWSTLQVSGLLPRYSHTSHTWRDYLFLVGGVTSIAYHKLGVGVINLTTLQAYEVCPPAQDPEYPILLCNHSSYLQDDQVVIVGGGGNCFSFGTHFNEKIVSLDVKSLL